MIAPLDAAATLSFMFWLTDLLYLLVILLTAPVWLVRMIRTGKIRTDWKGRFGFTPRLHEKASRRVLLHAVSVGEINAVRLLVERLAHSGDELEIVIATTTDTGFERARELYSSHTQVVRYPFDFSLCVNRFLNAIRPDLVVLVELEVWPNFTAACRRRRIPVGVINGRLTRRSHRRYTRVRRFIRPSFQRLSFAAVQNRSYADRFTDLGVDSSRIHITDTMKWDTARISDDREGADALAEALGIDRHRPLVVAGSTSPDEHALLVEAMPEGVQLLCAPRKPEWFDQAARDLPGCARRSKGDRGSETGRFLLDTIGELRSAYALADVVVIGRSFGNLHGSDMMEPIALGKPVIVGPAVTDFQDTMNALLAGGGIVQTDRDRLAGVLADLLQDESRRFDLVEKGREVIRAHQGSTERNLQLIRTYLDLTQED